MTEGTEVSIVVTVVVSKDDVVVDAVGAKDESVAVKLTAVSEDNAVADVGCRELVSLSELTVDGEIETVVVISAVVSIAANDEDSMVYVLSSVVESVIDVLNIYDVD